MSIAKTIHEQINMLEPWALARYGAKQLRAMPEADGRLGGLMFKCSGVKIKRGGLCTIELMPNDLYKITVGRLSKFEFKKTFEADGVFAEDLVLHLEEAIG